MRTLFDRPPVLALWLFVVMAAALALRVVPGRPQVEPAGRAGPVVFRESDPWYHVRAIEHQVANFPERFRRDPFLRYPEGGDVPVAPLFDWIAAAAVRLRYGAHPEARDVEAVAAWLPPLLAAFVVLPVARLAWRLGRRKGQGGGAAAALAGALVALLPGQLLARSLFGFTDHHVLEVLTSSALLAALAGSLDEGASRAARRLSALAAAAALVALLLTWVGAAAIVLLVALWIAAQFAVDLFAGRELGWLESAALPPLGVATLAMLLLYDGVTVPERNRLACVATLAVALALAAAARLGARPRIAGLFGGRRRAVAALAIGGVALLALAGVAVAKDGGRLLYDELLRFGAPAALSETVTESAALSSLGPPATVLWAEFAAAGPLAALGFLVVAAAQLRRRGAAPQRGELLLLVWAVGLALFSLRQNRFLYYAAVPVALFAALAVMALVRRLADAGDGGEGKPAADAAPAGRALGVHLVLAGALVLLLGTAYRPALARAAVWNGPSADWRAALDWLRRATPEPFGDATVYWKEGAARRAAYAVGSWWDYGYWILRGAHRVPAADPTQSGAGAMARLLLAPDDAAAAPLLDAAGVRYLVLDAALPMLLHGASRPTGKMKSIALWAGEPFERYLERVEQRDASGAFHPATLFHPAFYRTLLVRTLLFDGAAYEPGGAIWVAEFGGRRASGLRELVKMERFESYGAAAAAVAARNGGGEDGRFGLVGLDPAVPCVPLVATELLQRVWASSSPALRYGSRQVSEVEIFERVDFAAGESAAWSAR